jgi:ISXO2-like transposase domain
MSRFRKTLIAVACALGVVFLIAVVRHYQLRWATEAYIAQLKAQGEPMDLAQVVPPPVPPEQNSADALRQAAVGNVHTNGLENFWSLLKRAIRGTYVSVEPFHLFRYLDEQAFRFNERENTDSGRFLKGIIGVIGKRLQFVKLTSESAGLPALPATGTWKTA